MHFYNFSEASHNTKVNGGTGKNTGKVGVSTGNWDDCPTACVFQHKSTHKVEIDKTDGGCYAVDGFHLSMMTSRLTDGLSVTWNSKKSPLSRDDLIATVERSTVKQIRHFQSGDHFGDKVKLDWKNVSLGVASAKAGRVAWSYTHYPVYGSDRLSTSAQRSHNLDVIAEVNRTGYTMNISANNLEDGIKKARLGLPVCTVGPEDFKGSKVTNGVRLVQCPATVKNSPITCSSCGNGSPLCYRTKATAKTRNYVVVFPAHGRGKNKAGNK